MDPREQVGGESDRNLARQRLSSHENPPMFNHGRLQPSEHEDTSMFVDQEPNCHSASPGAQNQHNLDREIAGNSESEDDDEHVHPPGCGSCKNWAMRFAQKEKVLQSKRNIITDKNRRLKILMKQNRELKERMTELEKGSRRLKRFLHQKGIDPGSGERIRSAPNPYAATQAAPSAWKDEVRDFYSSTDEPLDPDSEAWETVWKAQYKQGNIPVNLTLLHPDIRLKKPEDFMDSDSIASQDSEIPYFGAPVISSPRRADFNGFDKLPAAILVNILDQALFFAGRVVHIFSRLDPYQPPADRRTAERLPGRIYISNGERAYISLTYDTISPNKLLSPLRVNRKWNFFGAHIFYGRNTFAFSSFGEFGRFCQGIGRARLQRIAHLCVESLSRLGLPPYVSFIWCPPLIKQLNKPA
ncbi:hypothetical protein N0V93_003001 [Gnomoniopsis smithogilvyi]|uniref:Uncharacterized protein n=1 Tax=Gnomoniopsis smithogilvyi TaxID=1191159 RepID=A0A9W8YXM6_9PEZI|nr:hypothetical protein N0V93_003001 [Gnomoniopsis smithogilvyi]